MKWGLLFFFILTSPSHAQFDFGNNYGISPFVEFKSIEDEKFRITFPKESEAQAKKILGLFNEAHELLASRLHWEPKHIVTITLLNNTDLANGLASPALRFGIILYLIPPEPFSSTNYYEDWLRLLVFHEYTHYLNIDPTTDWMEGLRIIFGDVVRPNGLWPTWMLEGLAVYYESRLTHAGRGKSPYYRMILRAAERDERLGSGDYLPIDRMVLDNPYAPTGEGAYFFGFHLIHQVAKNPRFKLDLKTFDEDHPVKDGEDAIGIYSLRSSHRFPFFINDNLFNVAGTTWLSVYDDFINEAKKGAREDLSTIRKAPVTEFAALTKNGISVLGNAYDPKENKIYFTMDTSDERPGLYSYDRNKKEVIRLYDKIYGAPLSLDSKKQMLFGSEVNRRHNFNLYYNLVAYDLKREKKFTLDLGERARDPNLNPDSTKIVYQRTLITGETEIVEREVLYLSDEPTLGSEKVLHRLGKFDRASQPIYCMGGIVYSEKTESTVDEELIFLGNDGSKQELLKNGARNRMPSCFENDTLIFVSDLSGVDNVFKFKESKVTRLTNAETGIWYPNLVRQGDEILIFASVYTSFGWQLSELKPLSSSTLSPELKKSWVIFEDTPPQTSFYRDDVFVKPYSPWSSLLPRQWAPVLYWGQSTSLVGAEVLGFDQLDFHRYYLYAAYDSNSHRPDAKALYEYRGLGPTLSLGASHYNLSEDIKQVRGETSLSFPFKQTWSSVYTELKFIMDRVIAPEQQYGTYLPKLDLNLVYSNLNNSRLAISPEGGRTLGFGIRNTFDPGSNPSSQKILLQYQEYFRIKDHAVFSLKPVYVNSFNPTDRVDTYTYIQNRKPLLVSFSEVSNQASLDYLSLRGYPRKVFLAKEAFRLTGDVRVPFTRIFRGIDTLPLFFKNLYSVSFVENFFFPGSSTVLPSAGTSIKLSSQFFGYIPVVFSLDYHYGLNQALGGMGEFFAQVTTSGISF